LGFAASGTVVESGELAGENGEDQVQELGRGAESKAEGVDEDRGPQPEAGEDVRG
jgi:hypothetical protein